MMWPLMSRADDVDNATIRCAALARVLESPATTSIGALASPLRHPRGKSAKTRPL